MLFRGYFLSVFTAAVVAKSPDGKKQAIKNPP